MAITVADLRAAKWRGEMFLDGEDFYRNVYQCVTYPGLSMAKSGPSGRPSKAGPQKHERAFFVNGAEVPDDLQAVCDALNAKVEGQ